MLNLRGWRIRRVCFLALSAVLLIGFIISIMTAGPWQAFKLRRELNDATRLIVRTGGHCHRYFEKERTLYDTTSSDEIHGLLECIGFDSPPMGSCRCCGDMSFDFYRGEQLVKSFSYHHKSALRIQYVSGGDFSLTRKARIQLEEWLNKRTIYEKFKQVQEELSVIDTGEDDRMAP